MLFYIKGEYLREWVVGCFAVTHTGEVVFVVHDDVLIRRTTNERESWDSAYRSATGEQSTNTNTWNKQPTINKSQRDREQVPTNLHL